MSVLADLTRSVGRGDSLGRLGARAALAGMIEGADEDSAARFLLALNARGPKEDELLGFAEEMRERSVRVSPKRSPLLDTCGTGGDGLHTINLSTASAFVAAGAGAAVVKHGNRSVSSRCGSADVLEALGVAVDLGPGQVAAAVDAVGFGFCFAPAYHPAMASVSKVRRKLGVRTVFNLLGPLANPARVTRQVVGIFDGSLLEAVARVLVQLGAERVLVVRAEDGMDEFSPASATAVVEAAPGSLRRYVVAPEDFGLKRRPLSEVAGGGPAENAAEISAMLDGRPGALREAVLVNAAAALYAAGLAGDLRDGFAQAARSVDSGSARAVLQGVRK